VFSSKGKCSGNMIGQFNLSLASFPNLSSSGGQWFRNIFVQLRIQLLGRPVVGSWRVAGVYRVVGGSEELKIGSCWDLLTAGRNEEVEHEWGGQHGVGGQGVGSVWGDVSVGEGG
jgi:hypothetical protein